MSFQLTDSHVNDYHQLGFTVFRAIVPLTLLKDLRRESEKGRLVARLKHGESAQRLQPVKNYPELDIKPFADFAHLPEIDKAIKAILGPTGHYGLRTEDPLAILGVLYEPATQPWCTQWHRDWRDNAPGLDVAIWEKRQLELGMFNQVNCALYEDSCTWVVPGSHLRRDTGNEIRRFPDRPVQGPNVPGDTDPDEAEAICLAYTMSMPGAFQAHLNAGDFMLYRNSLWHLGNYVPYKKRATIHDAIGSPEFSAWVANPPYIRGSDGKPVPMQNANIHTPEYAEAKGA